MDFCFFFTTDLENWQDKDVSFLDLLEPHIWMVQAGDFYERIDYKYERFDPVGYEKLVRMAEPLYRSDEEGHEHWGREPYVFASSVIGPAQAADFGKGGISWLTGTASWAYIAATQYLLGIRPTFDGLEVKSCLPSHWTGVKVSRRFRGKTCAISIDNSSGEVRIEPKPKAE
jgi:hypothetical protein